MDIMDSTDTPTGGLDGSTASRDALPLSVDQRDDYSSTSPSAGGRVPTSNLPGSTSPYGSSSAFDRLDAATGGDSIDPNSANALPTSTDDLMMPTTDYATHPSVLGGDAATSASPSASASESMDRAKASASDAAASAKAKASSMADSAKSGAGSVMSSLSDKLHKAEDKAEGAYRELKADVSAHLPHARDASPVHHPVRSTLDAEATDTHPDAASMRDAHLHPGRVSLPTHTNATQPTSTPHVSSAHQRGLDAGAASTEPKDASASTGVVGALSALHGKLEDGAEAIKEKVDDWAEAHLRSSPKPGQHLSEAHPNDIPTLTHHENEKNNDMVLARLHPSSDRAGSASVADSSASVADSSV